MKPLKILIKANHSKMAQDSCVCRPGSTTGPKGRFFQNLVGPKELRKKNDFLKNLKIKTVKITRNIAHAILKDILQLCAKFLVQEMPQECAMEETKSKFHDF